jgi:hypothetical protein
MPQLERKTAGFAIHCATAQITTIPFSGASQIFRAWPSQDCEPEARTTLNYHMKSAACRACPLSYQYGQFVSPTSNIPTDGRERHGRDHIDPS